MDDGGGLENRYTGDCIVGSNPTPSAKIEIATVVKAASVSCRTLIKKWFQIPFNPYSPFGSNK